MHIPQEWLDVVPALQKGQHLTLLEHVLQLRQCGHVIYPEQEKIFYALQLTKPAATQVIILGQDPYHGKGQAQGLAFSVPENIKAIPPSLKNIFKEISTDIYGQDSWTESPNPCLERWATQGVLLLNTVLSVEEGKAHSHAHLGWQNITKSILESLAASSHPLAVLLWGKPAQNYAPIFSQQHTATQHLVLTAPHPSPLSAHRGFLGCKHFSRVNTWLKQQGKKSIEW